MNKISLKWLKISIIVFSLVVSCNKNKKDEMKIGYYNVTEIVTYQNGLIDTNYYTAIGPEQSKKNKNNYTFSLRNEQFVTYYMFDLEQKTSKDSDSTLTYKTYYNIAFIETSDIELFCNRVEVNDSFTSNIHFKYIE